MGEQKPLEVFHAEGVESGGLVCELEEGRSHGGW